MCSCSWAGQKVHGNNWRRWQESYLIRVISRCVSMSTLTVRRPGVVYKADASTPVHFARNDPRFNYHGSMLPQEYTPFALSLRQLHNPNPPADASTGTRAIAHGSSLWLENSPKRFGFQPAGITLLADICMLHECAPFLGLSPNSSVCCFGSLVLFLLAMIPVD